MRTRRASIVALGALLFLTGCGSDDDGVEVDTTEADGVDEGIEATFRYADDASEDDLAEMRRILGDRLRALDAGEFEIRSDEPGTIVVRLDPAADSIDTDELFGLAGETAQLRFRPVTDALPGDVEGAPGFSVTPPEEDVADQPVVLQELDGDEVISTLQLGPTGLTGPAVEAATAQISPAGTWSVNLVFTTEGIDAFNDTAAACFARDERCATGRLAIVLDSEIITAPTIQQPEFVRDEIQISGAFTEEEAANLALVLRYGALPVLLELESVRPIEP